MLKSNTLIIQTEIDKNSRGRKTGSTSGEGHYIATMIQRTSTIIVPRALSSSGMTENGESVMAGRSRIGFPDQSRGTDRWPAEPPRPVNEVSNET